MRHKLGDIKAVMCAFNEDGVDEKELGKYITEDEIHWLIGKAEEYLQMDVAVSKFIKEQSEREKLSEKIREAHEKANKNYLKFISKEMECIVYDERLNMLLPEEEK